MTASSPDSLPVVLITGAAKRIGARIAAQFHAEGYRVIIHYRNAATEALALQKNLNAARADSAYLLQADLNDSVAVAELGTKALACCGRVDVLVNNASSFYATPLDSATEQNWDELINSNVKAAFFLSQSLAASLQQNQGCIINIVDMHADSGLKGFPVYSIAKAALKMLTHSLARELAPLVRVNGVAPGAILWPEHLTDTVQQQRILDTIPLRRLGSPDDIASAVWFLVNAHYMTGQVIKVDGGKSLG